MTKTSPIAPLNVTLYALFRIEVANVQEATALAAVEAADAAVPYHRLAGSMASASWTMQLPHGMRITDVAYTEDVLHGALVTASTPDDDSFEEAFGPNLAPYVEGVPADEFALKCREASLAFMAELLDSVETLGGVAEQYGSEVLAQIIYLNQAILTGQHIDTPTDDVAAALNAILSNLPSATTWAAYIR